MSIENYINMEKFIKYKRFQENLEQGKIQEFLDNLIRDGWEIIYYNEEFEPLLNSGLSLDFRLRIVVVAGKKQQVL